MAVCLPLLTLQSQLAYRLSHPQDKVGITTKYQLNQALQLGIDVFRNFTDITVKLGYNKYSNFNLN